MATKRKLAVPKRKVGHETLEALAKALKKCEKAALVDVILKLAKDNQTTLRSLMRRFDVQLSEQGLIEETKNAIVAATDFDECDSNTNFDYDSVAYDSIERNFQKLIRDGHLAEVMQMSLELMRLGSRQVEMSDEGMMTDEIADCLKVVIASLKKSDLPKSQVVKWCDDMTKNDCVGFICDSELSSLQKASQK